MARSEQDLPRLRSIAAAQGGVASPADFRACGFSAKAVRHRVEEGAWHRVGSAVVLAPPYPNAAGWSDTALSWILHLTYGPQVLISGALALRRAQWRLPCASRIVVVGSKPNRTIPGVNVLRRPHLAPLPHAQAPQFVPAREALVDCLTVLSAGAAADLLDTALQRRYVRADTLADDLK